MTEKIKSEIISIDLTDASYKDNHARIEPTFVNFFFGNNGAGKSTVAKAIKSGTGLTYASGKTAEDYLILVYNQEFIDDNFRSYRNMRGVFTLNARNAAVQAQIDEKTEERKTVKAAHTAASTGYDKTKEAIDNLTKAFYNECWKRGKTIKEEFPKTQSGKGRMELFANAITAHEPKEIDIEELRRLYDSAFSDNRRRYDRFSPVIDTTELDSVPGSDILAKAIVNSANTELAVFLKTIGATEWAKEGHEMYSSTSAGKCPYCGQSLPEDFEKKFIESFDTRYQDDKKKLTEFLVSYRDKANNIYVSLQNIPAEIYPKIDIKPYTDKLSVLKATIQSNIDTIKSKIDTPSLIVTLEDTAPIFEEIKAIIDGYNVLIDSNNAVVDAGPKKQTECTDAVFSLLAFQLKDIIAAYDKSNKELNEELKKFEEEKDKLFKELEKINGDLRVLQSQTVETETAKDSINQMLRDTGMQGFSLEPKAGVEHVYEVRRPDGAIADNLSEGEKNFIAFLYFYHLVHGSESADGETRDKIVVIDDPVSSMDSGSLFIVGTLVRQMIEICRNNADNRNKSADGNFIKQIFILTHNAYFHREISYSYVPKYEYASFYLIKKFDSKSYITLCKDRDPNEPTAIINKNPVKNSYAALWEEYKELNSAVPLMNVIRRILEYYFLQLCGYEGSNLREVILVKGKENGLFKDADGNDDNEKFQLASAMLSYINASSIGMSDGKDYVEDCFNAEECKQFFKMIFEEMGQKQHYDMMMR